VKRGHLTLTAFGCVLAAAACGEAHSKPAPHAAAAAYVDSALPIQELLRRFRADLAAAPAGLTNGAPSRDALVARFVAALEHADTIALEGLAIDRAEFAYLYYPDSPLSRPPYELAPGLMWFQLQGNSRKGALSALRLRGGRPLGVIGYRCDEPAQTQGENRVWSRCEVRHRWGDTTLSERLFGGIIERGGRYKLLGYANGL